MKKEIFIMASRNGVPTMLKVAKELCRLLALFTPVILKQFPDRPELSAALAAANAACGVLATQLEQVRHLGD